MKIKFSRAALYELVWTQPRSTLAKTLGISDVALAKHCIKVNLPMPPRGYWARLSCGKSPVKPPLPARLPGQRDTISFGPPDSRNTEPDSPQEQISPPIFSESLDELVSLASSRIGTLRASRNLDNPHPGLLKVLSSEATRRDKYQADPSWSFHKPYFDAPEFQRQLRIINSLFWGFERIGCTGSVQIRDQWVHGSGTLHFLAPHLRIGDITLGFQFMEPAVRKPGKTSQQVNTKATILRVDWWHPQPGHQEWQDLPDLPLEHQLTQIASAFLEFAERCLRSQADAEYAYKIKCRDALEESIALQREKEALAQREAAALAERQRRELLFAMVTDLAKAEGLRELVAKLERNHELKGFSPEGFSEWRSYALGVADQIDPLSKPFNALSGPDILRLS